MKIIFHLHTNYSTDSNLSLDEITRRCKKDRVECLIVTDHNNIEGAKKLKKIAPFKIVIGEEINTSHGEIIGLFLKSKIKPDLSPEKTITEIKKQGGLVVIPHPFDWFRRSTLKRSVLEKILPDIDIFETFNGRCLFNSFNQKSVSFARQKKIKQIVGPDAHFAQELSLSFIKMPEFDGAKNFLKNLDRAKFYNEKSPFIFTLRTIIFKLKKKITKLF